MPKSVKKIPFIFDEVKVILDGTADQRKAQEAKVMKCATDFEAKLISQREEEEKTVLTFRTGNNGDSLKVLLSNLAKSVEKVELHSEVVKVTLTGTAIERKAEEAKVMKLATDFKAKLISQREEDEKTFLTFQTGDNGNTLEAVLSN
ncbi:MAG: hypothetical protein HFJ47_04145 [Clostridia bacterium]|nr:hypothetical protein [Clostridia bacterium]